MLRFAVLLIVATISTAQAQEGKTAIGPLDFSCGNWINALEDTGERAQLRMWILGYLSGFNVESTGADFLRDRDADGLMALIDNYCRRNPLRPMPQAIQELVQELRAGR